MNLLGDEQHAPEFRALNPQGQVPVLVIPPEAAGARPQVLAQSMAILAYLEERFPTPPLLPPAGALCGARAGAPAGRDDQLGHPAVPEPVAVRLAARGWASPIQRPSRASSTRAAWPPSNSWRPSRAGKFLVGDAPTIADVYLTPQLYAARRFAWT